MNAKWKLIIWVSAFVLFIVMVYFLYGALSPKYSRPDESAASDEKIAAPDFTVYDRQGNTIKLSDYVGKPIVLNFWASWCSPCKSELPHFNEVYAEYKDKVVFMIVDLTDGQRETKANALAHIEKNGYSFPVYFDLDESAANTYGISSIPTTYLIGEDGYIAGGYQGAIDENTLRSGVKSLLGQ